MQGFKRMQPQWNKPHRTWCNEQTCVFRKPKSRPPSWLMGAMGLAEISWRDPPLECPNGDSIQEFSRFYH